MGVAVVVVLGLKAEGLAEAAFVAVAAGDGITDEFDFFCRQRVHIGQLSVGQESPELGLVLIALDAVHQTGGVTGGGECRAERDHRVAGAAEGDLEGLGIVDLRHEVAAAGLALHAECGALEGDVDLCAGVAEAGALRVLETDAADVLDVRVGGGDGGGLGCGAAAAQTTEG